MLIVGDNLPDFKLNNQDGDEVSKKNFIGKYNVLYFYPKDNTPGCTKEACDFTSEINKFKKLDIEIYGVSPDSVKKHQNFISLHKLKINLLADVDKELCNAMGVIGEKKMFGKTYLGVIRTTFIINPKGKIEMVYNNVKVAGHINEVYDKLKKLK